MKYTVNVGNIGNVYSGSCLKTVKQTFEEYKELSVDGVGRAGGESIYLSNDTTGDIIEEYIGELDKNV